MPHPKTKEQIHRFAVTGSGQEIKIEFTTNKLYNTCTGVNIVLTDLNAKFSEIELEINTVEVFPEYYEVIRARLRETCPIDFDHKTLNETAGGSLVKGKYIDVPLGQSYPYMVSISFKLENK